MGGSPLSSSDSRSLGLRTSLRGRSALCCLSREPLRNEEVRWDEPAFPPDKILVADTSPIRYLTPVWIGASLRASSTDDLGDWTCEFPPSWKFVVGGFLPRRVWNAGNPLSRLSSDEMNWLASKRSRPHIDPLTIRTELTNHAAAWIRSLLEMPGYARSLWNGVAERDRTFLEEIWRLAFPMLAESTAKAQPLYFLSHVVSPTLVEVITPECWLFTTHFSDLSNFLPDPGRDWKLWTGEGPRPWEFPTPERPPS